MGHERLNARDVVAALSAALLGLLTVSCGGGDGTAPNNGPSSGTFTATIANGGTDSSGSITLAAGGTVTVVVCGPVGADFNLAVGGLESITTSNCEHVTTFVTAGRAYRPRVTAVSGNGAYNGCWVTGSTLCTVATPVGMACSGVVPGAETAALPAGYYDSARNKCGPELLAALTAIVSSQTVLGYTSARDSMYAFIDDLDNDDVIEDLYTGRRAPNVNSRSSALVAHFNAEHTWPQSRGAGEDPAMSDLNHLYASDSTANVTRSNYPYGTVTGSVIWQSTNPPTPGDVSRLGYDATGQIVFEPRPSRRGDIARGLFYFYVRYNTHRTASFTLTNWNRERAILLQWHAADPVSDNERTRNNLVYRAQHNRNPFIDGPALVAALGSFPQ